MESIIRNRKSFAGELDLNYDYWVIIITFNTLFCLFGGRHYPDALPGRSSGPDNGVERQVF